MYSIHAICYTYNNIHIPRYIYMQPYVGIIYYIIFNSWRFLLLTPVLNLISCCCNGFAHCHRHCTVLFTRRGRHLVITINIYDIRIIHVQLVSRIYMYINVLYIHYVYDPLFPDTMVMSLAIGSSMEEETRARSEEYIL